MVGKYFTDEKEILCRYTEYCLEVHVYSHVSCGITQLSSVLDCRTQNRILIRLLAQKLRRFIVYVETVTPTKEDSFEVENIPTELYEVDRETMIDVLFNSYNKNQTSAFFCKRLCLMI